MIENNTIMMKFWKNKDIIENNRLSNGWTYKYVVVSTINKIIRIPQILLLILNLIGRVIVFS